MNLPVRIRRTVRSLITSCPTIPLRRLSSKSRTADGKTYTQPLTVKMDPRVKMSPTQLEEQFTLSKQLAELRAALEPFDKGFHSVADELRKLREQSLPKNLSDKVEAVLAKMRQLG